MFYHFSIPLQTDFSQTFFASFFGDQPNQTLLLHVHLQVERVDLGGRGRILGGLDDEGRRLEGRADSEAGPEIGDRPLESGGSELLVVAFAEDDFRFGFAEAHFRGLEK